MAAPDGVDPAAWAALLKWSIAQTGEGDGTSSTPAEPMSKEKRDFLEAVMKDGVVDLVKRAGEILEALHEGTKVSRPAQAALASLPSSSSPPHTAPRPRSTVVAASPAHPPHTTTTTTTTIAATAMPGGRGDGR